MSIAGNKHNQILSSVNTNTVLTIRHHDHVLDVTATGSALDITFPAALDSGFHIVIKRNSSSDSNVNLIGAISATLTSDDSIREYTSDGTSWIVLNRNGLNSSLESYASGTNLFARQIESFASGVESLRQSMTTGGDVTQVTNYASGIESMRQAMTIGINPELESYASGIDALAVNNQSDVSRLEPLLSGIASAQIYTFNRALTNILPNAQMLFYDSQYFLGTYQVQPGFNDLYTVGFLPEVPNYWSGTKTLANINQTNITNLTAYASGIETLRQSMTTGGDTTEVTNYASGINNNLINTQNRVTVLEGSSGGNATKQIITHDDVFQTLNAVYKDSSNVWQKSKADTLNNSEVVGVVESTSGNQSTIVMGGIITNSLITAGLVYYLSDITDGALQTSEATNISKPVMIGIDSGVGIVQIFRSLIVSGSSSAVALPRSYLAGYGTAPYTTSGIQVSAGSARSDSNEFNIITSNTIVKKLTGPFVAGTLQNGIDSGNRAASTTYHVHEITDGTNVDTLFSTSATSPTLPSGYVAARRIMSFKTNSTGWIPSYVQFGDKVLLKASILDVNGGTVNQSSSSLVTLSVPSGVTVRPIFGYQVQKAATVINARITCPSANDEDTNAMTLGYTTCSTGGAGSYSSNVSDEELTMTDTSSRIRIRAFVDSCSYWLRTFGWIDTRGKDN